MSEPITNALPLGFDIPNHFVTAIDVLMSDGTLTVVFKEVMQATRSNGEEDTSEPISLERNASKVTMPLETAKLLQEMLNKNLKDDEK